MKFFMLFLLFFVLMSSAEAVADGKRVRKAQAIAEKKWGPVCNGNVTIYRADLDGLRLAEATTDGSCVIRFDIHQVWHWGRFCSVMLHEYGHLFGYRPPPEWADPEDPLHSTNPHSLMYNTFWMIHPLCKRR